MPFAPKPGAQAATSIDGKLIIMHRVRDCNDENETNRMHLFDIDIDTMAWRKLPSTIHKRDHCALVSHGRHVYAFVGFRYYYTPGRGLGYGLSRHPQSTAERLNIDTL